MAYFAELDLNNAKLKESTTVKESILIDRLLLKISEIRPDKFFKWLKKVRIFFLKQ